MSAALKLKEVLDQEYYSSYLADVDSVKSGEVTLEDIKNQLVKMEAKIDEWAEDSEFFDVNKATTLLGWSEAIIQDLPSYDDEVKWDLLGAILYFVKEDDIIPDSDPICGLDDDFDIMKAVLEAHKIELL